MFALEVDPRIVREVKPSFVRMSNKNRAATVRPAGAHRDGVVYRTLWEVPVLPEVGAAIDLGFTVVTATPSASLHSGKHPVVTLVSSGKGPLQRETGRTCVTRLDSRWE